MQCVTCNTSLSPAFKHAFAQNICPACGGNILDEESLALIEDIGGTILSEVTVREETAQKIATLLVAKYDINTISGAGAPPIRQAKSQAKHKIAPPSTAAQLEKAQEDVISADAFNKAVSDSEREQMLADAAAKAYNMVEGITVDDIDEPEFVDDASGTAINESLFSEGGPNHILERERQLRLQKQKQAISGGGGGSFRRSG